MKAVEERRGTGREEETGGTKISRGMKERREQEDGVISEERPKVTIIARNGASILNQFVNVLFHTVGVRRNPCNQCERQQGAARNFSDGESHQHNHTQPTDEEDCLYEKLDWVDLHPRSAGNLDAFETLDIWDITVCPGVAKDSGMAQKLGTRRESSGNPYKQPLDICRSSDPGTSASSAVWGISTPLLCTSPNGKPAAVNARNEGTTVNSDNVNFGKLGITVYQDAIEHRKTGILVGSDIEELKKNARGMRTGITAERCREESRCGSMPTGSTRIEEEGKQCMGKRVRADARPGPARARAHGNAAKEGQRDNDQTA